MTDRNLITIYFVTLLYFVVITPFLFIWIEEKNFKSPPSVQTDTGRNENSTPRSFILPANTAVAQEQERKEELQEKARMLLICSQALEDKGYRIAGFGDITSQDIFIETLRFQLDSDLNATGELDIKTRNALKCQNS